MASRKWPHPKIEALRESGTLNPRPRDVQAPLFQEQEFFDPRDLAQVKYEMLRCVRSGGSSVVEATALHGLSRPTFYKTRRDFEHKGLAGLLPSKPGPRGPHKLTGEVIEFLEQLLQEAELESTELAKRVWRRFGRSVHPRTIERALGRPPKKRR
jgi:transposase